MKGVMFFISLIVISCLLFFGFSEVANADGLKTINAKALNDHECNGNEWHFVINQIDNEDLAPSSITVSWSNGSSEVLGLDKFTGGVAHYSTGSNLDSNVTDAHTDIYKEWSGQFNLSHGPCNDDSTPTPLVTETPITETETPTVYVTETPTIEITETPNVTETPVIETETPVVTETIVVSETPIVSETPVNTETLEPTPMETGTLIPPVEETRTIETETPHKRVPKGKPDGKVKEPIVFSNTGLFNFLICIPLLVLVLGFGFILVRTRK